MVLNPDFREFIKSLNSNKGLSINFINLDNLKRNKEATGRHQDLADLENLES
jgi:hypothetical protein